MTDLTQPIPGYEVLELLGSGGMSSVYKARHKGLDRIVAIKVIRRDQIDPGLALARLTKEARVLARMDHPAIVRSIDFGEVGDLVFFVMELVEGRSCKQVLVERGKFPLREVILIGERVALALGHAASHGVVHRDVKPANILLAKDGAVKLTDFGLARATRDRSLTQDGITVGTPQYMSPEQVRSPRRVDLRSDLYSLGATLYHLATGEPPFRGDSVGEILHDVLYAIPKRPEQLEPTIPPSFSRVLARLLAKDARRRYSSSRALIADLEVVKAELAGSASDDSVGLSWQESAEPPPRTMRPWLLVGAALVVAAVTGFALVRGQGERSDPTTGRKSREETVLARLDDSLDAGIESPANVLATIGDLRREGALTELSSLARVDLKSKATAALERQLDAAFEAARGEGRKRLEHGDFAGAAAAFEAGFARRTAEIVPEHLASSLAAAEADPRESVRRRSAAFADELHSLAQRMRSRVRAAVVDARDQLNEAVDLAIVEGRILDARALLTGHAERELAAARTAARAGLVEGGVAVAAETTDEELARGWPDSVRSEVERDPATSFVEPWQDQLERVIVRRRDDLVEAIRRARDDDVRAVEAGDLDSEPPARRREREQELAAQTKALADAGALPEGLAEEWAAFESALAEVRGRLAGERESAALARLLEGQAKVEGEVEGDGESRPGLIELLMARDLAGARKALAAAEGLSSEDAAAWRNAVEDLAATLEAARASLAKQAGSEVTLRNRRGVAISGRIAVQGETFTVGTLPEMRVEELHVGSLEPFVTTAVPTRRVALLFLLGEARDHERLDAELEKLAGDRVVDALRQVRADERLDQASSREQREAEAVEARAALDDAIAKGDGVRADKEWARLRRLSGTAAARAASAQRQQIVSAIDDAKRNGLTRALLDKLAPNASDRAVEADGSVHLAYRFDRMEEGHDFALDSGLFGNRVQIANGRLEFAGGEQGRAAREEGPVLRLPLDRRAPATLRVEVVPSFEEKRHPHFVGLRLGGACVGFYRPNEPVRETFEPQLAAWFGSLNEFIHHFADLSLGVVEPTVKTKIKPYGLERGRRHAIELRWLPEATSSGGTLEVWLDDARVYELAGAMTGSLDDDGLELRSRTALRVEFIDFKGRLKPP